MKCDEVRDLLSDYLEQYPNGSESDPVGEHLRGCDSCRREADELRLTLKTLSRVPRLEPAFDLWPEFAPKFRSIRAQAAVGPFARLLLCFSHVAEQIRQGWMIYTSVLRHNYREVVRP